MRPQRGNLMHALAPRGRQEKRAGHTRSRIRKLFGLVRDDVLAATGKRQEPFIYGSLGGDDYVFRAN